MGIVLGIAVILLGAGPLMRAAALEPISAIRTDQAPCIDGRLDDEIWLASQPATEFVAGHPVPDQSPSQPTEFWVAYDMEHIYIAFRCHDAQPDRIRSRLAPRDAAFDGDWVGLILNGSGAIRGAAELFVNPHGSQMDAMQTDQGDDPNVDYIFSSAASRDAGGWSAEMSIPFQSLRFQGGERITMSLIALRHISRTGEKAFLPGIDLSQQGWQACGTPVLFEGASPGRIAEVVPAWIASAHSERREDRMESGSLRPELSLSCRFGMTHDLTLSLAWQPDFSHVEAAVAQVEVNRRFPVYYPEKRPFFLEGQDIFSLAAEGHAVVEVFHSRTIQSPHLGAKLTGSLARGHSIGVLAVVDRVGGLNRWEGGAGDNGQRARAALLRYRIDLPGNSTLGAYGSNLTSGTSHNRVVGCDADLILTPVSRLATHVLFSHTRSVGCAAAHEACPDPWGYSCSAVLDRREKRYDLEAAYAGASPRFRLETGFLKRSGTHRASVHYALKVYPGSRWLNCIRPAVRQRTLWSWRGRETDREMHLSIGFEMTGQSWLQATRTAGREQYQGAWFDQGGWKISAGTQAISSVRLLASWNWRHATYYDPAHPLPGTRRGPLIELGVQPWGNLSADLRYLREGFHERARGKPLYTISLMRGRLLYQPWRCLYLRAVVAWDDAAGVVTTDLLASFTTVPGTVFHVGYGSIHELTQLGGEPSGAVESPPGQAERYRIIQRDLFLKASYNLRF